MSGFLKADLSFRLLKVAKVLQFVEENSQSGGKGGVENATFE